MRRRRTVVAAVSVVVLVVAAVLVALHLHGGSAAPPQAAPPTYDPPHRFDAAPIANLPREADGDPPPVVLHGFLALVALPGRVQVIDTRAGAVRAEARAEAEAAEGGGAPR